MSKIRKLAITALLALSALACISVSHAETLEQPIVLALAEGQQQDMEIGIVTEIFTKIYDVLPFTESKKEVDPRDLKCLSKNIFYEAASEPEEGKVAVGLVTLNRAQDGRFGNSICDVVEQRSVREVTHNKVIETHTLVTTGTWIWKKTVDNVTQQVVGVVNKVATCQFSWHCMNVKPPKQNDERWVESQRIAAELLSTDSSYLDLRDRFSNALYFHAHNIKPVWARMKNTVGRVGGHYFYSDR